RVLAAVLVTAERLGSLDLASVQLRRGIVPWLPETLAHEPSEVRVLVPVAPPQEFSGALDILLGFAAEASDPESVVARLENGDASTEEERERFAAILKAVPEAPPSSHRTQSRAREWDPSERDSALFYRAPDEPARFETGGLTAAV